MPTETKPIVIAIDGPGASGKSTNARRVAEILGFVHVDTGAMYRALAWYCLKRQVDLDRPRAIADTCRKWATELVCVEGHVRMLVDGYYPEREIRSPETTLAVSKVAAVPKVRQWMCRVQRDCVRFGNLVMEGRDIGTAVFPETEFKFFLDACIEERTKRRWADGFEEDLATRDRLDSQRASAPLMIALGARVINTSKLSVEQTSQIIIDDVRRRIAEAVDR